MTGTNIENFAKSIGISVDKLIDYLSQAGIENKNKNDAISDDEKMQLLEYIRSTKSSKNKISEKNISGGKTKENNKEPTSKAKTKDINIRKKRIFSKSEVHVSEVKEEKTKEEPKEQENIVETKQDNNNDVSTTPKEENVKNTSTDQQARKKRKASKTKFVNDPDYEIGSRRKKSKKKVLVFDENKIVRHKSRKKIEKEKDSENKHQFEKPTEPVVYEVELPEYITVSDLASKMSIKAAEVIKSLMSMGVMATINEILDQDTANLVVEEMGHKAKPIDYENIEKNLLDINQKKNYDTSTRPPVITIMGHVDHGKTSLLDYIRKTRVASGEAGGITQHIGAYQVNSEKGFLTFLDTPGHAAFTSMRARGANCTDIVILVVAADDGVKPQTIEAIEHSKAANVPMIVAVNKIDTEGADQEKVKTELSQHEVVPEDWGGDNIFVPVSAKTGEGIDNLLESIHLLSEVLELKAISEGPARGIVLESSLDKGRGAVATVLVQEGCMKSGENILCGKEYGRIRAMIDQDGNKINEATPSVPVVVLGLSGTPNVGDEALASINEKNIRDVAQNREDQLRDSKLASQKQSKVNDNIFNDMESGNISALNILLKCDVQGSVEAISDSIKQITHEEVEIKIISSSVGAINESDVILAEASQAIVMGFNVRADSLAKKAIAEKNIDLRYYSIIYELIEDVKAGMSGLLTPETREEIIGLAEVKDVFKSSTLGAIAGCQVVEGVVKKDHPIRVLRDNVVIYEGELESLRRFKDEVKEVKNGTECGIGVKNYNDVKTGDNIEVYERVKIARTVN